MNILWIEHPTRFNRYDDWLHHRFAQKLNDYVDNVWFYGPDIQPFFPKWTPYAWTRGDSMRSIVKDLGVDIILLDSRASAYDEYYPKSMYPDMHKKMKSILPQDFREVKIPKVCIEEDFHYEDNDDWHVDLGFDLILQRHYCQFIRDIKTPKEFLPFSVDTDVFQDIGAVRKNRFCTAGTIIDSVYFFRKKVSDILAAHGLVDIYGDKEVIGDRYVDCLRTYKSHISGGSRYSITPAKTFEIMASGSVLFTNKFMGIEHILDDGSYVTYEEHFDDVYEKAGKILHDDVFTRDVTDKAKDCIRRRHSHDVRCKELVKILGGL